jgi:hypothetical protein
VVTNMTDLEMVKLCAEAMGWRHLGAVGIEPPKRGEPDPKGPWCLSGANDWWLSPDGHHVCGPCCGVPADYLNDDAQAMALLKRFPVTCIDALDTLIGYGPQKDEDNRDLDMNREIVRAVAMAHAERATA